MLYKTYKRIFEIIIVSFSNFFSGHKRTVIIKKNVVGSFVVKGLSILISLFLVPLTINLLDKEKYGIWITIYSIVTWFNMMDIGLGNGFRNKFAEAITLNKTKIAQEYISTYYSAMILIAFFISALYLTLYPFVNWYKILNIPNNFDENINIIMLLVFILFGIQFTLKNISTVLLSLQKTMYSNSLLLFGNILALGGIVLLSYFSVASLLSIALIFMASTSIVFLSASVFEFKTRLKIYKPKFTLFPKKHYLKELGNLGIKFFIIQITTIIMFSSSNIIITQLYGPSEVTPYNIAFRLFAATQTFFTIIITPFWAAFSEANAVNDFEWVKRSVRKLNVVWILFSAGILIVWIFSPILFRFWVGDSIIINYDLTFQFALYSILIAWLSPYVYYISAVSKIKLELYIAIFQMIFNIPLAIFLAKVVGLGSKGIIMSTNINLLIPAVLIYIQYKKLINRNASGIWNS